MQDNFCPAPWMNLDLHPSGCYRPCCVSSEVLTPFDEGASSAFSHPKMSELRRQFLANQRPDSCRKCFVKEEAGAKSVRQDLLQFVAEKNLEFHQDAETSQVLRFDLSFSNFCNMACRFCGPYCSTRWIDQVAHFPKDPDHFWQVFNEPHWKKYKFDHGKVLEAVQSFPNLVEIEIKGGEPFLVNEHLFFLRELVKSGASKKLNLVYTTNGSAITDEYLQLLAGFKSVRMSISVDGVGKLYQYIRNTDHTLEEIEENIKKISEHKNIDLKIHLTLCGLNIFGLKDFFIWYREKMMPLHVEFSWGMVVDPIHLDPLRLPEGIRREAVQKIDSLADPVAREISDFLRQPKKQDGQRVDFWRYQQQLDKQFNTNLFDVAPEFLKFKPQPLIEI